MFMMSAVYATQSAGSTDTNPLAIELEGGAAVGPKAEDCHSQWLSYVAGRTSFTQPPLRLSR